MPNYIKDAETPKNTTSKAAKPRNEKGVISRVETETKGGIEASVRNGAITAQKEFEGFAKGYLDQSEELMSEFETQMSRVRKARTAAIQGVSVEEVAEEATVDNENFIKDSKRALASAFGSYAES